MNNDNENSSELFEDAEPEIIFKIKPGVLCNNRSENYKIIEEPKFCVIRSNFKVEDSDFTDFEKRKLDYFIQTSVSSKVITKKFRDKDVNTFIKHKLLSSKEESYRFCNMFSYDVDMAINHLINYIDIIKRLKEEYNFFELCDSISNREVHLEDIFYYIGKDYRNRPIIGIDFTNFDKSKFSLQNVIEEIIIPIMSNLNDIFESTKYSINNNNQQIILILNIDKLSQSDLPQDYSAMIKLFQYLFPSRLHQIFIKSQGVSLLSHIEDNFFEYNLEKMRMIDLNNIPQMKKDFNIEFDLNILVDFLNNPIKSKLDENENLASFIESNQIKSVESCLKLNEVEPNNSIIDREIQKPFNLERIDYEKTNFTGKDLLNSIDISEGNIVIKPYKYMNELQIEKSDKLNILYLSQSSILKSHSMAEELLIENKNSFSILPERNIIQVKPIIKRKKENQITYESKKIKDSCNIDQCNII